MPEQMSSRSLVACLLFRLAAFFGENFCKMLLGTELPASILHSLHSAQYFCLVLCGSKNRF